MNLAMVLEMAAQGYGGRTAIVTEAGDVSYEVLFERAGRRAASLAADAERAGAGHIAYLGMAGDAFVEHLLAAAWAGLPFVPLNYRTRTDELGPLLEAFRPVVLVHDDAYADKARDCTGDADLLLASDGPAAPAALVAAHADGEQVAIVLHTSGTTSRPKPVPLLHRHLCSYIFGVVEFGSAAADETALVTVPPYHIAGIMGVLTPIYSGRRIAFLAQFDPVGWLAAASKHRATHAFLVPTMLARIVDALEQQPSLRPRSLRHVAYGGGPIHRATVERALRVLGDVDFVNAYGLTETSSTVALLGPDDHRAALSSSDPAVRARLGSVGRPLPTIDVRIVGDDGAELPAGEVGLVTIAGPQVSGRAGGAFTTGDLGYVDDGGYLFIAGRGDDVIIRGGENISPGEIEEVLARHPDVGAIAVVGIADEDWGERVVAFVEPRAAEHASGEDLRDWARPSLASFKLPETFVFVDELPRTDTGKVLRRRLRELHVDEPIESA